MKSNKLGLNILVIVLGVLFIIVLAGGIAIAMMNKVPSIKAKSISGNVEYVEDTEYYDAEVTTDGENFTLSKGQQSVVPNDDVDDEEISYENTADYVCPYSSERYLTEADLEAFAVMDLSGLPAENFDELKQLIINEIYARHGLEFTKEKNINYFNSKQWYRDIGSYSSDKEAITKSLNVYENANVHFLRTVN